MDLSRKRDRERLAIRRNPYFQMLGKGAHLGFRRGPDTWIARHAGRDGRYQFKALDGIVEFEEAKRVAEDWFKQAGGVSTRRATRGTVAEALDAYLGWMRDQGRSTADVEWRIKLTVNDDPIAAVRLEDATADDFREWRKRLQEGRQARTVNRLVRAVAAGLNRAVRSLGYTGNPEAWRLDALADDREDEGTAVFLSAVQRTALIAACEPQAAAFLRGLEMTGARPGELAAATVGDLHADTVTLRHRKGRPAKLRARAVILNAAAVAFFKQQAKRKLPAAPLFTDPSGVAWRRHTWSRAIVAAITEANKKLRGTKRIPPAASAYSFRHARISELLQVHGVDPLTVAQQTGTSIAMIEKAYFKFIASAMREKLAAIKEA